MTACDKHVACKLHFALGEHILYPMKGLSFLGSCSTLSAGQDAFKARSTYIQNALALLVLFGCFLSTGIDCRFRLKKKGSSKCLFQWRVEGSLNRQVKLKDNILGPFDMAHSTT